MKSKIKKLALMVMMVAVLGFAPRPAAASGLPVIDVAAIIEAISNFIRVELRDAIVEARNDAAAVFWNNGVQAFVNNLASETAVWVASGDEGQKPLLFTDSWDDYLQEAGENALANVAIEFAKSVGLGNICVSPQVAIDILLPQLGFGGGGRPECTLKDLSETWDVTDPKFLENFTLSFQTDQNDLGVAISFLAGAEQEQEAADNAAKEERQGGAFKAVKSFVSELVETPAPLVQKQVEGSTEQLTTTETTFTGRIITDAIRVFTSTLAGQYLQKLQSGFFSLRDVAGLKQDTLNNARNSILDLVGTAQPGAQNASQQFTNVFKPDLVQANDYNIIAEMTTCPAEVAISGVFNCVIDSGFASALQASGEQGLMTVRQAVERGYLHGDWSFGFTDPGTGTEPSYLNGYAYTNMKKMRRARIIPVGWELAALRSRQLSQAVDLARVLRDYGDSSSPFYRLVDPNWVLKVPQSRCTANGAGQVLQPNSKDRFETCADIQDCVVTGDDGQCQTWGYCTNEKRTWAFPGQTCPAEFATCEQYVEKGSDGSEQNLWLAKSLDYKGCSAQTGGCLWYALAKNAQGQWRDDDRVYLNSNAKECDAADAGCRRYIRMVAASNLLRNASFEDDGGHNYVLGNGDSDAENGIPDGWSARAVDATLDIGSAVHGGNAVRLQPLGTAGVCLPGLVYTAPLGSFEVGQQYTLSGQVHTDSGTRDIQLVFQGIPFVVKGVSTDWTAFAFQFVMPATANNYTLALGANNGTCSDLGTSSAVFYDALQLEKGIKASSYRDYGTSNIVSLKKAPTCSFEDVGCLSYKEDGDRTATAVNGIVTGANLCPLECVGYATLEQQATPVEPAKFANFIPSTASTCSAEHVGCQAYTNLNEVAAGGEGLEYYSDIRHCAVPQPQCATFYAWEGSDQTGYQLMTYNLKAQNADGTGAPLMTDGSTACNPSDVNCRELISQDGSRNFRDLTKTVICSDQCAPLRAGPNTVTASECVERLGTWDSQASRCVFQVLASESRACPAQYAGCREYVGNTGKNIAVVFNETFEDGEISGWTGGTISSESTTVGGHSLKLGDTAGTINATTQITVPDAAIEKGYELELSVKASVPDLLTVTVWLGNNKVDANRLGGFITGTRQWNQYRVGPLVIPSTVTEPAELMIEVRGASARTEAISVFVDNLTLRQIKDSSYLVKDSWRTPATCETNPPLAGGSAGRSMLGCKAYTVRSTTGTSSKTNATGFSRLCSQEKVGCEAVIDTFNSAAPYRQIYQEGDIAERVVPEDQVRFVVNRPQFVCQSSQVGCMELGQPQFDVDGNLTGYKSVYRVNNPDAYDKTLCKAEGLFCKEFTTSSGSVIYAKHPGKQQCEYREVPNSFPTRNAWFKVGGTEEDPAECLDAERNSFALRCPADEVSCNEYFEPITRQSFYYRKNTLTDRSAECNGIVNWQQGCVVFDDKTNPNVTFKSGDVVDVIGAPDPCQTNDVGCNTNILLKVSLDRVCSQWLTGVSTSRFWDRNQQQFRTTAYTLGRCVESDPINPNICLKWDNNPDKPILNLAAYKARDISWGGEEYSGYSIPNQFPAEVLRQRSISTDEDGNPANFRLTKLDNPGNTCTATTDCPVGQVCRLSLNPATAGFQGNCYVETGIDGAGFSAGVQCRAYPEDDAPFPASLAVFAPATDEKSPGQITTKDPLFKNANISQNGEDVDCSYRKVFYGSSSGGGQAYYFGINTIPPSKLRIDGEDTTIGRKDAFIGWTGYCLEYDTSRAINGKQDEFACLTWYPVDVINGALDFNNSALKSGYVVPNDRESYCVESTLAEYRATQYFCKSCANGYRQIGQSNSATCSGGNRYRICEPIGGEGWYPYDGSLDGAEATVGIGQMCTKVARIATADGRNRAWTTRIMGTALPGARIYFVENLGWGPNQQNYPYGAARTLVSRLEDLSQPLIVRDPNTFIDSCKNCKIAENEPYGLCQDEAPERNGRRCPLGPNTGSPYALLYKENPSLINDANVKVRRDNKLPDEEPQPYPGSEDFTKGFSRLEQLFARSYGIYQWQSAGNICVGVCEGGINSGEVCESEAACGDPDNTVTYTCVGDPVGRTQGTCIGGFKHTETCAADANCQATRTGTIHQCVAVSGPNEDPNNPTFACESGPFQGRNCNNISDCDENQADGVCSFERRCQAHDTSGGVIVSTNSSQLCNTTAECNSQGSCRVQRCSTEAPGANSGVCTGKTAGDTCGTAATAGTSQYVRIPGGQPAVGWDIVLGNPAAAQTPTIRPTIPDTNSSSGFAEASITGFSVNGSTDGELAFNSGRAPVTVSFYAYNDNGEQMPLRILMVNWGDGTDPAESRGAFPNHKHVCRRFCSNAIGVACKFDAECQSDAAPTASCLPFNFGDSLDACLEDSGTNNGYFTFSYTYTCESASPCRFKPSVMVRDNWGATARVSFPGTIVVNPAPVAGP